MSSENEAIRVPSYGRHKPSGQAVVTLNGRDSYLGKWNTKANRRVAKLHSPPGSRYFGCRHCHDLTYNSCQEAHQAERLFGRLGVRPEHARMLARDWGSSS